MDEEIKGNEEFRDNDQTYNLLIVLSMGWPGGTNALGLFLVHIGGLYPMG